MHEGIPPDQRAPDRGVILRRTDHGDLAPRRVDLARACAEQPDVRVGVEERALAPEPLRPGHVVGVEPCHERRARHGERAVEGGREPGARLARDPEAPILHAGEQRPRGVGRAVVDDDQLQVARGLREHARHRLPHPRRAVVDGHEDRDGGNAHACRVPVGSLRKRRFKYGRQSDGGRPAARSSTTAAAKRGSSVRRVRERAVSRKKRQP